jgi:ATP-dependent DNA helicase DinG
VIEVEVHQQLRALLREQGGNNWPHQLTVARLVARALRLQRSTLMQVSSTAAYQGQYRLSYLASLLLWPGSVALVAPLEVQQALCHIELPRLREWLHFSKPVYHGTDCLKENHSSIVLLSPEEWLAYHFNNASLFSPEIPLVIDGAENLDRWTRTHLTQAIAPSDWDQLLWICPAQADAVRDARAALTRQLFQHPPNPYGCVTVDRPERETLIRLMQQLATDLPERLPMSWRALNSTLGQSNTMMWADLDRQLGSFTLQSAPVEVASVLSPLWQRTTILLSGTLDLEPQADTFRLQVGLGDLTCVQFATDRQNEALTLYLPDGVPMPNTPEFALALMTHLHRVLTLPSSAETFSVLIIDDLPLKTKVAAILAAEFGSRVKVERTDCGAGNILIAGWDFWQKSQRSLPHPQLLAIATLPFPSLENPKVAGRVAYYKQQRQDWFRLCLLPEALQTLQKAIAPLRTKPSLLALFDNRVLHRTYGQQVLSILSPYARLDYLDPSVLILPHCSV